MISDKSPENLSLLQRSWVGASKKQRDELLDFIRHLAEDDKEGVMATKVQHNYLFEGIASCLQQIPHGCAHIDTAIC